MFSSRVKYITEDAASVCTWYLKFHTHMDEFRMPETPSVDLRHDTHRDMSHHVEARDQIPHPLCMGIKFPIPGKAKAVKCQGYARWGGDVEASI